MTVVPSGGTILLNLKHVDENDVLLLSAQNIPANKQLPLRFASVNPKIDYGIGSEWVVPAEDVPEEWVKLGRQMAIEQYGEKSPKVGQERFVLKCNKPSEIPYDSTILVSIDVSIVGSIKLGRTINLPSISVLERSSPA